MLQKQFRLTKKNDIGRTLRRGLTHSQGTLVLKLNQNGLPTSRFAFLASKKSFPRAVQRNRAKRLFREIVRSVLSEIRPGYDIVLIIKQGQPDTFPAGRESLVSLFKKAKMFKPEHA